MENEIMNNEEIIGATEEIATAGYGKGVKIAAGIGLAVLASGIAYKYAIKPIAAKIKAKKKQATIDEEADDELCENEDGDSED